MIALKGATFHAIGRPLFADRGPLAIQVEVEISIKIIPFDSELIEAKDLRELKVQNLMPLDRERMVPLAITAKAHGIDRVNLMIIMAVLLLMMTVMVKGRDKHLVGLIDLMRIGQGMVLMGLAGSELSHDKAKVEIILSL